MPIRAKCEGCGKLYSLKDSLAGKRIRCPACKGVVVVPGAAAESESSPPSSPATPNRPPSKPPPQRPPSKPPSSRPPSKPPPQRGALTADDDDADPNATAYTPSPVRKQPPRRKSKKEGATVCPACGKAMSPKQVTCSECGYNVKLRRRLSITDAIKRTDRAPGVRFDGTRYLTRAEKAEVRVEQGRKIRWGMLIAALVVLLVVSVVTFVVWYYVAYGPALVDAREAKLPFGYRRVDAEGKPNPDYDVNMPLKKYSQFHPYCVGMNVDMELPLSQVHYETPDLPDETIRGEDAPSRFAQACRLPFHWERAFIKKPRVLERMGELDGSYRAVELKDGVKPKDGAVVIWRLDPGPEKNGFLDGALLDFGAKQLKVKAELSKAKGTGTIRVIGQLTFIMTTIGDLREGPYAFALRESLNLQVPGKVSRVPKMAAGFKASPDEETDAKVVFHPVILVSSYTIQPAKPAKKDAPER